MRAPAAEAIFNSLIKDNNLVDRVEGDSCGTGILKSFFFQVYTRIERRIFRCQMFFESYF